MFTSKKANPVRVYAATATKSKSPKPPAFSNIINEDNESKVYEEMMEQQLREITKLKMSAIERIPAKVNPIVCLLQMPNVETALSNISQNLKLKNVTDDYNSGRHSLIMRGNCNDGASNAC